ncbi:hypothetical protein BDV59DRAFT_203339 [Aspergillus ambiguus]|uniref:uncharacterized protein n=1 Tax=Aspergillus ambiguus TaxID=176160 RepID=UPI003CCD734E
MDNILVSVEEKIRRVLKKVQDNTVHKEVDTVFYLARKQSQKVTESQKRTISHIAVTSLTPDEIRKVFEIKEVSHNDHWTLSQEETRTVPDHLNAILADYSVSLGGSPENEALMRCRIDTILLASLAAQKRASSRDSGSSILSVHFQLETDMRLPWKYEGEQKVISGKTDYSLWYNAPEEMECNLLVVEAKRKGESSSGVFQVLAYMAMLHNARKEVGRKDVSIYGIATDSFTWSFLYLDNQGRWSRRTYEWGSGQGDKIVSWIHKIIRQAASLSKKEFESNQTGVNRTLSGHSKLEGFFHGGSI